MHNNVYLLTCVATGEQLLIDAADEAERVLALIRASGRRRSDRSSRPTSTGTTSAPSPRSWPRPGRARVAGAEDADALPVPVDVRVGQGDAVRFGEVTLDVIHLRGHTPGVDRARLRTDPEGHDPPVHRRLASSPAASATRRTRARASTRSSTT